VARRNDPESRAAWLGVAMLSPAVVFILALVGVPFVMAFVYAMSDATVGSTGISL